MSPASDCASISVVVPVYNGRRYLQGALDSILAQTLMPRELVLVDDGSADGSVDLVAGLATPFPVRVLRQENAGQSSARNLGVAECSGELIAFLDQDDRWYPHHLETLAAALARDPAVAWAYTDFDEIDGEGNLVTRGFLRELGVPHPKTTLTSCIAHDLMVLPSASMIRRSVLAAVGGFDEELVGYEDDDLFVRIFRAGWQHAFVDRPSIRFRIHGVSSSADRRFFASRRRYAEKLAAAIPDDPRMRRYYLRDLIAPRFFETCLDDYVRACSLRDWPIAEEALAGLNHFARLRRPSARLGWKMWWVQSPRMFRRLVRLNDALPARLRFVRHPGVTLR
jgi:glycosyltransferase involved in cell wall biosynthesis